MAASTVAVAACAGIFAAAFAVAAAAATSCLLFRVTATQALLASGCGLLTGGWALDFAVESVGLRV